MSACRKRIAEARSEDLPAGRVACRFLKRSGARPTGIDSIKDTSRYYGQIASQLARPGTPIPQNDIWIAALAIQWDRPLASNDKHFEHVQQLRFLHW